MVLVMLLVIACVLVGAAVPLLTVAVAAYVERRADRLEADHE